MTAEIPYSIHPLSKPPRATRRLQGPPGLRLSAALLSPAPRLQRWRARSPFSPTSHFQRYHDNPTFPIQRKPWRGHQKRSCCLEAARISPYNGPGLVIYRLAESRDVFTFLLCETRLPTREKPNAHSILLQRRGNFWSPGPPPRAWAMERCGHRHPKFSGQCCCCVLRAGDGCRGRRAGCPISRSTSREPVQASRCSAAICFSVHSGHEFVRHELCFLREQ